MEPDEAGEYKIASGWGLVKQIRISGDRYIGPNAEAPEGENETVDKFGRIAHLFGRSRLFTQQILVIFSGFLHSFGPVMTTPGVEPLCVAKIPPCP